MGFLSDKIMLILFNSISPKGSLPTLFAPQSAVQLFKQLGILSDPGGYLVTLDSTVVLLTVYSPLIHSVDHLLYGHPCVAFGKPVCPASLGEGFFYCSWLACHGFSI